MFVQILDSKKKEKKKKKKKRKKKKEKTAFRAQCTLRACTARAVVAATATLYSASFMNEEEDVARPVGLRSLVKTGRWTDAEHAAFETGLRRFGTQWKLIQTLVPTRTLVQIRTHAQKYFVRNAMCVRLALPARSARMRDSCNVAAVFLLIFLFSFPTSSSSSFSLVHSARRPTEHQQGEGAGAAAAVLPPAAEAASAAAAVPPRLPVPPGASGGAGMVLRPVASIRHVALEPAAGDSLGLIWAQDPLTGAVRIDGFVPVLPAASAPAAAVPASAAAAAAPAAAAAAEAPAAAEAAEASAAAEAVVAPAAAEAAAASAVAEAAAAPAAAAEAMLTDEAPAVSAAAPEPEAAIVGAAEASDLLQLGDIVLGVTGVCTLGMDPAVLSRAISAAASVTPGGVIVLHVSRVPVDVGLVEELAVQMALAASELLGGSTYGRELVENAQAAVYASVVLDAAGSGGGAGSGGSEEEDGGARAAALASTAPWGSRSAGEDKGLPAGGHAGVLSAGAAPHLIDDASGVSAVRLADG